MILARKSGWLISCDVIKVNPKSVVVKPRDSEEHITVYTKDTHQKLFDKSYTMEQIQRWMIGLPYENL